MDFFSTLRLYKAILLAVLVIVAGCKVKDSDPDSIPSSKESPISVQLKQAANAISLGLTQESCESCHGSETFSPRQVFRYLDLRDSLKDPIAHTVVASADHRNPKKTVLPKKPRIKITPSDFRLFRILASQEGLRMPMMSPLAWKAPNKHLLDNIQSNHKSDVKRLLKVKKIPFKRLYDSMGTQVLYQNQHGICFDKVNTGKTKESRVSLCKAFEKLASAATRWMNIGGKPSYWPKLQNLFVKDIVTERKLAPLAKQPKRQKVKNKSQKLTEQVVYNLPQGQTMSFYIRVAPDQSFIGMRVAGGGASNTPFLLDTRTKSISAQLVGSRYDPTFTPDFNRDKEQGFLIAQRGVQGNSFSKRLNFYTPKTNGHPVKSIHYPDISGYPSIAKIDPKKAIPNQWKRFAGKYVIMGKRWRWGIFDTIKGAFQKTIGVTQVYPAEGITESPICTSLSGNHGFNHADALLSPDGRWISTKRSSDQSIVIINTSTCKVEAVMRKNGLPLAGSKAMFSDDGRYVTFHSYGDRGLGPRLSFFANSHRLKTLAQQGQVANIFVFDIQNKKIEQITNYRSTSNPSFFSVFPSLSPNGKWVYFHRHGQFDNHSQIIQVRNPLYRMHKRPNLVEKLQIQGKTANLNRAVTLQKKSTVNKSRPKKIPKILKSY